MSRPHWSYSQIACFQRCPLQYYFRYIAGVPRTSIPANMVLGTAVHAGLATYHRAILHSQPVPFTKVETAFLDSWQTQLDNSRVEYSSKQTKDDLQELGLAMLRLYAAEEPPSQIRSVEKPLYVPLQTSTGYILENPLLTIADLITDSDDGIVVNEFKTSSRAYSNLEVEQSLQASCYIHAAEDTWAEPTTVRFIVFVKTKQPKIQRLDTIRDASNSSRLADRLKPLVERAMTGKAKPDELASLERCLHTWWRRKLNLVHEPVSTSVSTLKSHSEAGPLLQQLETWLHRPGVSGQVDVSTLLSPYRHLQANELDSLLEKPA